MIAISNISRSASIKQLVDFLCLEGHDEPETVRMYWDKGKVFAFAELSAAHASRAVQDLNLQPIGDRLVSVQLAWRPVISNRA